MHLHNIIINIVSIPGKKYVNRGRLCARAFLLSKKKKYKAADVFTRIFYYFFFAVVAVVSRTVPPALKNRGKKITLNDNVQTIIAVRSVLNVESVWGAVATEIL